MNYSPVESSGDTSQCARTISILVGDWCNNKYLRADARTWPKLRIITSNSNNLAADTTLSQKRTPREDSLIRSPTEIHVSSTHSRRHPKFKAYLSPSRIVDSIQELALLSGLSESNRPMCIMVVDGMEYASELARVDGVDLLLARKLALVAVRRHLSTEPSKSGSMTES